MIHHGKHVHKTQSIISGDRVNLIMFCKGEEAVKEDEKVGEEYNRVDKEVD